MALIARAPFFGSRLSCSHNGLDIACDVERIVLALLLCLATAVCYAEMAKLYPGTGSSYYFAEQSFLNHDVHWRYASSRSYCRWGSHLYYWIYPGVMVVSWACCRLPDGTIWPSS